MGNLDATLSEDEIKNLSSGLFALEQPEYQDAQDDLNRALNISAKPIPIKVLQIIIEPAFKGPLDTELNLLNLQFQKNEIDRTEYIEHLVLTIKGLVKENSE